MYMHTTSFAQPPRSGNCLEEGGRRKGAVVFAKHVEGRHPRDFVHVLGAVQKCSSLNDFAVNFLTGGYPWSLPGGLG